MRHFGGFYEDKYIYFVLMVIRMKKNSRFSGIVMNNKKTVLMKI